MFRIISESIKIKFVQIIVKSLEMKILVKLETITNPYFNAIIDKLQQIKYNNIDSKYN